MEAKVREFLGRLFSIYPMKTSDELKIQRQLNEYQVTIMKEILKNRKKYDFDKLIELIKKDYKYKTIPPIPEILKHLPKCIDDRIYANTDEGKTIVYIISKKDPETGNITKRFESAIVCTGCGSEFNTIDRVKKLRATFYDVKVRLFPKGTTIMGREGRVYRPDLDQIEVLIPENK